METNSQTKKKNNRGILILIGLVLFIVAIVLILLFLLHGQTKTTGEWSGEYTSESLTCKVSNKSYFIYESNNIVNSSTQINVLFNDNKLSSISLLRKSTYADAEAAKVQSNALEFAVNDYFGKNGLKPYVLSATFSYKDTTTQFSLYATNSDIDQSTIKYFMLDSLPDGIEEYQKAYQIQGFNCEVKK